MTEKGERIAKVIAAAGICSRRDAERMIEQGRVRVNGNTLSSPALTVTPDDAIEVDGATLKKRKAAALPRLWRYHKPAGLITSHHDPEGRPTVFEYLPPHLPRVISVGRLDLDSEGLLLLTDSGELSRALELPRNAMDRTYRVRVNGQISEKHIHMLSRGVVVDEVKYRPITVVPDTDKTSGRNRWLTVTLREGKNREIRRLFDYYGYPVSRLIRVGYAGIELGDLAENGVAEVPAHTVEQLLQALEDQASVVPKRREPQRGGAHRNNETRRGNKPPFKG